MYRPILALDASSLGLSLEREWLSSTSNVAGEFDNDPGSQRPDALVTDADECHRYPIILRNGIGVRIRFPRGS